MKINYLILLLLLIFAGCVPKPSLVSPQLPHTHLLLDSFDNFEKEEGENYAQILSMFQEECVSQSVKTLYPKTCNRLDTIEDAKGFIHDNFMPYRVYDEEGDDKGLLTGYYEPQLFGSLKQSEAYPFPVYAQPKDLINVDLSAIYPELKGKRLRGRLEGNTLVPYYTREELRHTDVNASVICYVNNEIDLFFLEVQGSGRISLDNNETIYVGYANQNGHRYRAIGRYLVDIGELTYEEVSLQSIRKWLETHPSRAHELLDYNPSQVFFQQKEHPASGSLGMPLTALHSVAVDRRYIPLGSLLYVKAQENNVSRISNYTFAQDTGGAIKGSVRADYFLGFGEDARERAGKLKAPLKMWVLLPKSSL